MGLVYDHYSEAIKTYADEYLKLPAGIRFQEHADKMRNIKRGAQELNSFVVAQFRRCDWNQMGNHINLQIPVLSLCHCGAWTTRDYCIAFTAKSLNPFRLTINRWRPLTGQSSTLKFFARIHRQAGFRDFLKSVLHSSVSGSPSIAISVRQVGLQLKYTTRKSSPAVTACSNAPCSQPISPVVVFDHVYYSIF